VREYTVFCFLYQAITMKMSRKNSKRWNAMAKAGDLLLFATVCLSLVDGMAALLGHMESNLDGC